MRAKSRQGQAAVSPDGTAAPKGLSRRNLLKAGATAGVAAALGGASSWIASSVRGATATSPPPPAGPDLIFVNGKIHTMDTHNRIVSAVTIKGGRFVEVGQGLGDQGPGKHVINLKGRTVVPGIIDNHNHIVLMGNRPGFHTPLENASSIADVQATYAARVAGIPLPRPQRDAKWITTIGGFHFNQFAEHRLPTLAELDAAVPFNPVFIEVGFVGPSATNTVGRNILVANGVTVGTDGSIATGLQSSRALLFLRQTLLTFEERKRSVLDAMAYALSLGVTTHQDQGAFQATGNPAIDGAAHEDNFSMHLPFLEVYDEGQGSVRLRINFLHMEADPETPELVQRLRNQFQFFGGDMVKTGGIGEFIAPVPSATNPASIDTFNKAALRVARARWRAEVHSLNRNDFQLEIQGFEAAHTATLACCAGIADLRWVVAHVPFITADYVNRLKALGGGLSLTGWRYLAGTAVNNGPPFRMIVDNGISAGMSSDGMQIAPMNPWLHMYYATTGKNALGDVINADQQITRQEVLELYTRRNGWFLREEHQLGSIEPGKLADLVVLNKDYFTVPDEELKQIRSILTVVDGQIVHDAHVLEGDKDRDENDDEDRRRKR